MNVLIGNKNPFPLAIFYAEPDLVKDADGIEDFHEIKLVAGRTTMVMVEPGGRITFYANPAPTQTHPPFFRVEVWNASQGEHMRVRYGATQADQRDIEATEGLEVQMPLETRIHVISLAEVIDGSPAS